MKTFDQTLSEMQIDALYSKNRHFNAAERKEKLYYRLMIPLIVLMTLAFGSNLYPFFKGTSYVPSIIMSVISIFVNIMTFFKLKDKIKGHRRVANRYLDANKKCKRVRCYLFENSITKDQIDRNIEDIASEISQINMDAEDYPTNDDDLKKAKINVNEGNESYTDLERNL